MNIKNVFSRFRVIAPSQPVKGKGYSPPKQDPMRDVGYIDSPMYAGVSIPRYNPDILLSREGYQIYGKMLEDEQVKAVFRFRRDAITARAWEFSFDANISEALGDKEANRRIGILTNLVNYTRGSFKKSMDGICSALAYGFSLTNKVFEEVDIGGTRWIGIKHLRTKPPHTFYFYTDDWGNLIRVSQEVSGRQVDIDPKRFIHYVRNSDIDEHYGRSELREAYRAWFSKDISIRFMNVHMERCGSGFTVLRPTGEQNLPAQGTEKHNALMDVLNSIRSGTGVMIPKDYELKNEQPRGVDVFKSCIEYHDMSIAKALLVPNLLGLSTQGSHGSFAQANTQLEAFLWMLDADAAELAEVLNEQLFSELGDLNFGDGLYPRFTLLPLSEAQIQNTVATWKDLVQSGAVQSGPQDEERLREMIGMPKRDIDQNSSSASASMNDEQVSTLQRIMQQVSSGEIPPDTGRVMIALALPFVSKESIDEMMKPIEALLEDKARPVKEDPAPVQALEPPMEAERADKHGETVAGKQTVKVKSKSRKPKSKQFSAAVKRVDFARIARESDVAVVNNKHLVTDCIDKMVTYAIDQVEAKNLGSPDGNPNDIYKFRFLSSDVEELRGVVKTVLKDGMALGSDSAKSEVAKTEFSNARVDMVALMDLAAKYMNAKSFMMAGALSDEARKIIQNILANALKYSYSTDQIKEEIYRTLAKKGMISRELAQRALGEALGADDPSYRIETAIRTNVFEAINEARFDYFNDPALSGFVEALEYSAVMDNRTTEICSHLDGHVHPVDSDVWDDGFRPPNHFNCRSLLVPVLKGDGWRESGYPRVTPQEGFW